jgi:hypothetical protein
MSRICSDSPISQCGISWCAALWGGGFVLPRPPPADFHVVVLAHAVRRVVRRDVGQVEQPELSCLQEALGLVGGSALLVPQLPAAGTELDGPGLVARLLGLPDLARQLLDLGPHRLGLCHPRAPRRVGLQHRVDLGRLDAAAGQRGLDRVGISTEQPDIDHSCSK